MAEHTTRLPALPTTHRAQHARSIGYWLVLLPLAIVILAPVWHLFTYALLPGEMTRGAALTWLPLPPSLGNFEQLFRDATSPVTRWLLNSLIVTTGGTLLVVAVSALSGYAFARLSFPGRNVLFAVMLSSLMVPTAVTLIPSFLLLRDIKLLNTHVALWMPALANAGGMFLLRQSFFALPAELEDAARVDGAGRLRLFWQIALPLVQPALVTQAMIAFLLFWNDLLWPLIVLSDRDNFTLTLGLLFRSFRFGGPGAIYASGALSVIPALLFYLVFHRRIIEGVTAANPLSR